MLPFTTNVPPPPASKAASTASKVPPPPADTPSSGWWSVLARKGLPRRDSFGFSENYGGDAAPPFCLDEDTNAAATDTSG
jgi:hypothetical protein